MKRAIILAVAAALSVPAFAAPETYVIDNNHTFPSFSYTHLGFSTQQSKFDKTTGKITIDRTAKTGSLDISIDAKSVNTGSEVFNGHLKGEDYFSVEKFPAITFKSNSFKFDDSKVTGITGDLTIKGVTKPVTLAVTSFNCAPHPFNKKEMCGANASTKIKRSEFNAGKNAPAVSDEVTLNIVVEAVKE
jgi:polyisoprenoid-binding protein YceI